MSDLTVAIIGAGISGLITAKEAAARKLTPVIFEKSDGIGGLWRYGLWKNFRTDLIKFNCAFSCKTWGKEVDVFPRKDQVLNYIEEFAQENDLLKYISFKTVVEKCELTGDDKWAVTVAQNGEKSTKVFDFLIVANGYNNVAKNPSIPGSDTFTGKLMHSMHYNFVEHFKETYNKILIVGGNFSGTEIATDIATHSNTKVKQIICSGHKKVDSISGLSGNIFISPIDMVRYSVYNQFVTESEDSWEREDYTKNMGNGVLTHEQGNEYMTIKKSKEAAFKTVNKEYIQAISTGKITIFKSPIKKIEGRSIILHNGEIIEADVIIFATGYLTELSFFNEEIKKKMGYCQTDQNTPLLLYYNVLSPHIPNLGFVGFAKGVFFPMIELQAKYLVSIFCGKNKPPPMDQMMMFVDKQRELRVLRAKLPILPLENLHQTVDFATVIKASPLTEELRKSYPLVYDVFSTKPFNSCIFNFIGKHASPVRAYNTFLEMLANYNDKLTPEESKEFVTWIASLDRNFDLLTNLFTGTFGFERVTQDFKKKTNLVSKGTAAFVEEPENCRSYHETVSPQSDYDAYFKELQIFFDLKQSRLRFQLKELTFFLNFKKNPLYCSDKVEAVDVFANLDISVNSLGKFTLTLLIKTDEVDQRISTKYKLQEE